MDPIKQKLSQNKNFRIHDPTQNQVATTNTNGYVSRVLHNNSTLTYHVQAPDPRNLTILVKSINETQYEFDKLKRALESPIYGSCRSIATSVRRLFNKHYQEPEMFGLYDTQMSNVRELNTHLVKTIQSCEGDVEQTRHNLDELVKASASDTARRNLMEKQGLPAIQKYERADAELHNIDMNKDPEKYAKVLTEVIDAQRDKRKQFAEWMVSAISEEYHRKEVECMMVWEDIFEKQLYQYMLMAVKTELYQRTLEMRKPIFRSISLIEQHSSAAAQSIGILSHYNDEMQEAFNNTITLSQQRYNDVDPTRSLNNTTSMLTRNQNMITNNQHNEAIRYER